MVCRPSAGIRARQKALRRANKAMDQTPRRAALASLPALVIASRWADKTNPNEHEYGTRVTNGSLHERLGEGHLLRRTGPGKAPVRSAVVGRIDVMQIASGRVVGGRVELEVELPEGAKVTVIAPEQDATFEADAETEERLLEAIQQCERGATVPLPQLLKELRERE